MPLLALLMVINLAASFVSVKRVDLAFDINLRPFLKFTSYAAVLLLARTLLHAFAFASDSAFISNLLFLVGERPMALMPPLVLGTITRPLKRVWTSLSSPLYLHGRQNLRG
jgi:hypothetical protein